MRFKLMQNSRLNSDTIIYLVKLIIHLYILCKSKWIKYKLSILLCFRRRPSWGLYVTSHVLIVTDENRERCIFSILPVLSIEGSSKVTHLLWHGTSVLMVISTCDTRTCCRAFGSAIVTCLNNIGNRTRSPACEVNALAAVWLR